MQPEHGRVRLERDALAVGVLRERREVRPAREVVELPDERLSHAAPAVDDDGGAGAELQPEHVAVDAAQLREADVWRGAELEEVADDRPAAWAGRQARASSTAATEASSADDGEEEGEEAEQRAVRVHGRQQPRRRRRRHCHPPTQTRSSSESELSLGPTDDPGESSRPTRVTSNDQTCNDKRTRCGQHFALVSRPLWSAHVMVITSQQSACHYRKHFHEDVVHVTDYSSDNSANLLKLVTLTLLRHCTTMIIPF